LKQFLPVSNFDILARLKQQALDDQDAAPTTTATSYPSQRILQLLDRWKAASELEQQEQLVSEAEALRDHVADFLNKATTTPVGSSEGEAAYEALCQGFSLHRQACELLLEGFLEDACDEEQVLAIAAEGDRLLAEANEDISRQRSDLGITG